MTDDAVNDRQAGYAYSPGDAPAYWNFGTYWCLLATSDNTQGRSTTSDEPFPEGVVAPPHVHNDANAIDSLNARYRRAVKARSHFPVSRQP